MSKKAPGLKKEAKDNIRWRGHEVTRIEAFSDAVFAFAVTLLIVSLEVPKNFDEMMKSMYGFVPFAICFAILFQIWLSQNLFFRRYGMHDETTMIFNAMLLFLVLFFVYPLKFLFNFMGEQTGGVAITAQQYGKLLRFYGAGFAGIYFLFALLYYRAVIKKDQLQLTGSELFETWTYIYRNIAVCSIGIVSIILTTGGINLLPVACLMYPMLIGPLIGIVQGRRSKLHKKRFGEMLVAEAVPDDDTMRVH